MSNAPPGRGPRPDTLFVANTRPTAPGGVPLEISMVACGCVVLVVLATMNPAWFLLLLPGWAILKVKCSKDLHIGSILWGWMHNAGRSLHRALWGGSTVAPLPANPGRFGIFR